jgi:hydrogenase nickel incorporation protein HypA/HybF
MHEMSLVQSLFSQLSELAAENQAKKIISVTMEIGPLSGVVVDSFQFGFDILSTENQLTNGAKLVVKQSPVSYTCTGCAKVEVTSGSRPEECPACGDLLLIPEGGDDLLLLQVEME